MLILLATAVSIDYAYSSQMTLSNSDDEIILQNDRLGGYGRLGQRSNIRRSNWCIDESRPTSYSESANDTGSTGVNPPLYCHLETTVLLVKTMRVAALQ